MHTPTPFGSLYAHGFARTMVAIPRVSLTEPQRNAERILSLATRAANAQATVVVFPELGLSGYSNEDLFHQDALAQAVSEALERLIHESSSLMPVIVVGAPLQTENRLFNTAVVIHRGRVLGVVPKSYLPNYREFYEKRQFSAARDAVNETIRVMGETVPFGADLLFESRDLEGFVLHVEICEDLWVPIPPSSYAAMAGATVLANLSASNITIGKADYRRLLCASQSARAIAAYLYTAADSGESTTDLAWDGHGLIYENGDLLAETRRFSGEDQLISADIDLERLSTDRMRTTSYTDSVHDHRSRLESLRRVPFDVGLPRTEIPLQRKIERFPYVPADPASRSERSAEVFRIQVEGLATRLRATGIKKVVIGVSGGLDSAQALIVSARTMDQLQLPRTNVLAFTMPGFATSESTLRNARRLMEALGVTAGEIDIRPSAMQMLRDIKHPAITEPVYDRTYENVQAGERTSHLFRLANHHDGLVVGTGDLSELALGWTTYGVGDQMAHYSVNASVPKTLVQFVLRWVVDTNELGPEAGAVLQSVLDTVISPELVPSGDGEHPKTPQESESVIGPFELQDFFLYYVLRFGFRPSRVAFLAHHAWHDRGQGSWPDLIPVERRNAYPLKDIKHWLRVFLIRFFQTSQFKRSAIPNSPKVGSGGSLSPRGDWRAPSDSVATVWLNELEHNVPDATAAAEPAPVDLSSYQQ
ncbi:MAG TPA: NAD(+) synthase [Candidatus Angelobacter sp.]|nr:NAD(+) synthase [Candidatus Angelobacter sp.]